MAIDDLLDEHEQSERVLQWLRENGAGLIGGIVLGLAAIGGWKWWQQHQLEQRMGTAQQYQATLDAIGADDKQAAAKVESLGEGTYATLAALELASRQVDGGQVDAAIATLRGIQTHDPAIASIVQGRLARLLIGADKAEEALKLVADASTASALEVRGDAQFALGQSEQARESYSQALARLDVAAPQRRLLELKLIQVGGQPASTEAQS